jgi:hypothetical protein
MTTKNLTLVLGDQFYQSYLKFVLEVGFDKTQSTKYNNQ